MSETIVQLTKRIERGDHSFTIKANKDGGRWSNGVTVSSGCMSFLYAGSSGDEVRDLAKKLMEISLELDALIAEANK